MKMKDVLTFNNCLFVYDQITERLPSSFKNFFTTAENQHLYNTRGRRNNTIIKTTSKSTTYGLNSVKHKAASEWNEVTKHINTTEKNGPIPRTKFITSLKEYIFNSYT